LDEQVDKDQRRRDENLAADTKRLESERGRLRELQVERARVRTKLDANRADRALAARFREIDRQYTDAVRNLT